MNVITISTHTCTKSFKEVLIVVIFSPYLHRERPKFQIKEDGETPGTGTQVLGEASGTIKVTRNTKVEDTVRARLALSVNFLF